MKRLAEVPIALRTALLAGVFIMLTGFSVTLSDKEILRNFEIIAFGNEYTGEQFQRVRKWARPIRMGIQGKYPDHFEKNVVRQARDLQEITGHPMELYYSYGMQKKGLLPKNFDKRNVNVILYYLPLADIPKTIAKYYDNDEKQVEKMVANSTCFAKYFRRKNEIRVAIVVFPDHLPPDIIRACVVEELTQILGLPNDSDLVKPSIFSDSSLHRELTGHDKLLLKILYDPGISHNMTRKEALRQAAKILRERHH